MTAASSGPVARPPLQALQLSNDRCYSARKADPDPEATYAVLIRVPQS